MTDRRGLEFKKPVKLALFRRAGGPENLCCEGCGMPLKGKRFDYDHQIEIWEMPSELREKFIKEGVPAEYGKVLGYLCCHQEKSASKTGERAHGDRIIEKEARADARKGMPIPGSVASGIKFKMNGDVVCRKTGRVIKEGSR